MNKSYSQRQIIAHACAEFEELSVVKAGRERKRGAERLEVVLKRGPGMIHRSWQSE